MARTERLDRGREAMRRQEWGTAFAQLEAADREGSLEADDLERLALAAHLTGREGETPELLSRAHQAFLSAGAVRSAARCAFWLGLGLLYNGDVAQGGGWLARAERLLEGEPDCVERGYLLMPYGLRSFREGETAKAYETFGAALAIGERFNDLDLVAMARHGQGRALIRQGDLTRGATLLDEAMAAVLAGDVSARVAGIVYCSVLDSCHETLDLRRAQEWTAALHQWCAAHPDLVPYRGHCLLQRAEIMQMRGDWMAALDEARSACERLAQRPAAAAALYRVGELRRLRGELSAAEEAYLAAGQWARTTHPGVALLRLAQGRVDEAREAIRGLADEAPNDGARARMLDAAVEIALAAKDVPAARAAADDLSALARRHDVPLVKALAGRAAGAVLLAEGDCPGAMAALQRAWAAWGELEAPYEAARTRVLIALACRERGDAAAAEAEFDAAREVFERLGAAVDLANLSRLMSRRSEPGRLTAREVEVIGLVASGLTNRQIADRLEISEKTVARHLSNIFLKLGLSSRSAATAYAYKHGLA